MTLQGKGFFIWQIRHCEGGDANAIALLASEAGLSHVVIKVADGPVAYNIDMKTGIDLVPSVVEALRGYGIGVWGWHYIYGRDPIAEADIAIRRIKQFDLDGYVLDIEAPFKHRGKDEAAEEFMNYLRSGLGDYPLALSSYRYPVFHPQIPWKIFLEKCDFVMPQFYWVGAHNPREQLMRSVREYENMQPNRPIIFTGSAFIEHGWAPTADEIHEFFDSVKEFDLGALNFWEWMNCRKNLPELWDVIKYYQWGDDPEPSAFAHRYIDLLNTHDPSQILELYHTNAYHITGERTVHGVDAIRGWYEKLFKESLPGAVFSLGKYSGTRESYRLEWTANTSSGLSATGSEAFLLLNDRILYHFSFLSEVKEEQCLALAVVP